MKDRVNSIHFVGIGGEGMCGIAEVLYRLGYTITGSDISRNANTLHLEQIGVKVFYGHNKGNINNIDVLVTSSAIKADNPEVNQALVKHIPIIPRALMLSELIRFKKGIVISGTHGKTTTTSLIASILGTANLDPTFIIGGKLNSVSSNAKLGLGDYIIAEADESDASFLYLNPLFTVITNIDNDHMETYDNQIEKQYQAFIDFIHRMPFYGKSFLCIDSENVRNILPRILKPFSTYGLNQSADIYASDIKYSQPYMYFIVNFKNKAFPSFEVYLNQPGVHNIQNALGAIGVALECKVNIKNIQNGLKNFTGIGRRFQNLGQIYLSDKKSKITLIDDYGHHPLEIKLTIETARNYFPKKRIVLVFQPHRYSRTRDLFEDFVSVLKEVDFLILTEVYPAGEDVISAADSKALSRAIRITRYIEPVYVQDVEQLPNVILPLLLDGDVLLIMGAGSINKIPKILLELSEKKYGLETNDPIPISKVYNKNFQSECKILELPIFLPKANKKITELTFNSKNGVKINVRATSEYGLAPVKSKDILIYFTTKLNQLIYENKAISKKLKFSTNDFLKFTGRKHTGVNYNHLITNLHRLVGTSVTFNKDKGGFKAGVSEKLLEGFEVVKDPTTGRTKYIEVVLPEWLYSQICYKKVTKISMNVNNID